MRVGTFDDKLTRQSIRRGSIVHIFRNTTDEDPYWDLDTILGQGLVPLLTLEPWEGLGKTVQWVQNFRSLNGRVYIRYGHEMNGYDWYPWGDDPEQFKTDWGKLTAACPINCYTVWCPNIDSPTSPMSRAREFWPGHADVLGLDGYDWDGATSAERIFMPSIRQLPHFPAPLWLCETATPRDRPGAHTQAAWVKEAKSWANQPNIGALVYFNLDKEREWALSPAALTALFSG